LAIVSGEHPVILETIEDYANLDNELGVRYEVDQPWHEAHNQNANIVMVNGVATVEYAGSVPAGAAPGSILCPTAACYPATWKQVIHVSASQTRSCLGCSSRRLGRKQVTLKDIASISVWRPIRHLR